MCFQRKDITPYILKYMDKQSEFLSFSTMYCGKTIFDNHLIIFLTTFPRVLISIEFFYGFSIDA